MDTRKGSAKSIAGLVALLALLAMLAGCGGESSSGSAVDSVPDLTMTLPDTLTGGPAGAAPASAPVPGGLAPMARGLSVGGVQPMAAGGDPCAYLGHGSGDPFRNGHTMTKFLVGAVASWTCITNHILRFIDFLIILGVPTDGTQLDLVDASHKAGDPTWLSIEKLSSGGTVVKLYWTADHVPPVAGDQGFYLIWNKSGSGLNSMVYGKLVVNVADIANDPSDPFDPDNDPHFLRLDFTRTPKRKTGDLYLGFGGSHLWVQSSGWRIYVVKNLFDIDPKYTAMGVIDMTAQWDSRYQSEGFTEFPKLKSFAVANSFGNGAAIASMVDMGLVLSPIDTDNDHLGTFLFTKDDRYYFGGGPPVVYKNVTAATYKGSQAIGVGGDITSQADIDTFLTGVGGMTGTQYGSCVGASDPDCVIFLNAIFGGGDFGAEGNVGTEPAPGDPKRDALDTATYFPNACPGGSAPCTWTDAAGGVFEMIP